MTVDELLRDRGRLFRRLNIAGWEGVLHVSLPECDARKISRGPTTVFTHPPKELAIDRGILPLLPKSAIGNWRSWTRQLLINNRNS